MKREQNSDLGTLGLLYKHKALLEIPDASVDQESGPSRNSAQTGRPRREYIGVGSAIETLTNALFLHGSANAYHLFVPPNSMRRASRKLEFYGQGLTNSRITLRPDESIIEEIKTGSLDLWFDPMEDSNTLLRLRSRISPRTFPISSTTHSISYHGMLHSWVLGRLLAGALPCDSIICGSHACKKAVGELFTNVASALKQRFGLKLPLPEEMPVIPLGVDTATLMPYPKGEARKLWGIPNQAIVLLCLGRFSLYDKADHGPLLLVFKRLLQVHPQKQLVLVLAGGDPVSYSYDCARYATNLGIRNSVLIIRDVPDAQRASLYNSADVFVSLADSLQESFGLAPVEAMACGVPQVVSAWDGYKESVVDGETGFHVPTYMVDCVSDIALASDLIGWERSHLYLSQAHACDLEVLYDRLHLLIGSVELRARMGECSRSRAVRVYSLEAMILRYEAHWRDLLSVSRTLRSPQQNILSDYSLPKYFTAFAHYASSIIEDDNVVQPGPHVDDQVIDNPIMVELAVLEVLDPELLKTLAERIKRVRLPSDTTIRTLLDHGSSMHQLSATKVKRHLMWLVKYGVVTVIPSEAKANHP